MEDKLIPFHKESFVLNAYTKSRPETYYFAMRSIKTAPPSIEFCDFINVTEKFIELIATNDRQLWAQRDSSNLQIRLFKTVADYFEPVQQKIPRICQVVIIRNGVHLTYFQDGRVKKECFPFKIGDVILFDKVSFTPIVDVISQLIFETNYTIVEVLREDTLIHKFTSNNPNEI